MNEVLDDREHESLDPRVAGIYEAAIAQHGVIALENKTEVQGLIGRTLERIDTFEEIGRLPVTMTREQADDIGSIFVLSGTGSYDEPFKPEDNPALLEPWMGGQDKARILHGTRLALQIAQLRSGDEPGLVSLAKHRDPVAYAEAVIAEYGPTIVYAGYPVETDFAEELLDRSGIIIPRSKAKIIHGNPTNTAEQINEFEYPDGTENMGTVIVSHAPHLAGRVLHILEQSKAQAGSPFAHNFVPYVSPVASATPEARAGFAALEAKGLVAYRYVHGKAAAQPAPYRLLGQV